MVPLQVKFQLGPLQIWSLLVSNIRFADLIMSWAALMFSVNKPKGTIIINNYYNSWDKK